MPSIQDCLQFLHFFKPRLPLQLLGLLCLLGCQWGVLSACQAPQVTLDASEISPLVPEKPPVEKFSPTGEIISLGSQLKVTLKLPPLAPIQANFATQALYLEQAVKIVATVKDSYGKTYTPVGAVSGEVNYPVGGDLDLSFTNLIPDTLFLVELQVKDSSGNITQADLAAALRHTDSSPASTPMNFQTTAVAKTMKALLSANAARARTLNLPGLETLIRTITGQSGSTPDFAYTTHPTLVNTALLASHLVAQNPNVLNASDYRQAGANVAVNISGLVGSDKLDVQITDAASALGTGLGNGNPTISAATPGTGLKVRVSAAADNTLGYSLAVNPTTLNLTEGGSSSVTIVATANTVTLSSMSPTTANNGSNVNLTGTGFSPTPEDNLVTVGGVAATVTAASATNLSFTVPSNVSGTRNVTVQVGGQTSNPLSLKIRPVLSTIAPNVGPIGSSVVLTGTGFSATKANNIVKFDAVRATVTVASPTSLTVTVPPGIHDLTNISVQVGTIISNTRGFRITPALTALTPTVGTIGSSIEITGTGFSPTLAENTVRFDSTLATITAASETSLTVTVPNGLKELVDVTVQVGTQTSATRGFRITPEITAIAPLSGVVGTVVTLTGTGFSSTLAENTVRFNSALATVTAASATHLTVEVPATFGDNNVTVQVGTRTSASEVFKVRPQITSLSLAQGSAGDILDITGTGFDTTAANNTVKVGGTTLTATRPSAGILRVTLPDATAGTANVTVQVDTLTSTAAAFRLVPQINSVSAPANLAGKPALIQGQTITINGSNFAATLGNNTVRFGAMTVTPSSITGTSSLTVVVPDGVDTPGDLNITVTSNSQLSNAVVGTVPVVGIQVNNGGFF